MREITGYCQGCGDELFGMLGVVHISMSDVMRAERQHREWEKSRVDESGLPKIQTLAEAIGGYPETVHWQVHCNQCNPHPLPDGGWCGGCYWFELARIERFEDVLRWNAHLHSKVWLDRTDWDEFILGIFSDSGPLRRIAYAQTLDNTRYP